jgi:hypothetical protein
LCGAIVFLKIDLRFEFDQGMNGKQLSRQWWAVWVVSHAFNVNECTEHIHKADKPGFLTFTNKFIVVYYDDILVFDHNETSYWALKECSRGIAAIK